MINLNHILVEHPQETHLTNNVSADHATPFYPEEDTSVQSRVSHLLF